MVFQNLFTNVEKTWCPGCPNYSILIAFAQAVDELVREGKLELKNLVITTGIGCHGKIFDYLKVNGYYGLHGRSLSLAIGIKLANPKLTVVNFVGDGDIYNEGLDHLIHAFRINPDITTIVHNNQVFALTTGQHTSTTEVGYKSKSLGRETFEKPLNPILLALVSGASFVARVYALDIKHMKEVFKEAMLHKGYSFIDVLQPCITFHDTRKYFNERVYKLEELEDYDYENLEMAIEKAREWDYTLNPEAKIPVGIFYKKERETLEEALESKEWYKVKREYNFRELAIKFFKV